MKIKLLEDSSALTIESGDTSVGVCTSIQKENDYNLVFLSGSIFNGTPNVTNESSLSLNSFQQIALKANSIFLGEGKMPPKAKSVRENKLIRLKDMVILPQGQVEGLNCPNLIFEEKEKKLLYIENVQNRIYGIPNDCEYVFIGDKSYAYQDYSLMSNKLSNVLINRGDITFLKTHPFDIDAIIAAYKVAMKETKVFVIDLFTYYMLSTLQNVYKKIPRKLKLRIKFTKEQVEKLAKAGYSNFLFSCNSLKIDYYQIKRKRSNMFMLVNDSKLCSEAFKEKNIGKVEELYLVNTSSGEGKPLSERVTVDKMFSPKESLSEDKIKILSQKKILTDSEGFYSKITKCVPEVKVTLLKRGESLEI